jgi:hypothetical protein
MSISGTWNSGTGYGGDPTYQDAGTTGVTIRTTNSMSANEIFYLSGGEFIGEAEL